MALNLDLCGIQLDFAVHNYKHSSKNDRFTTWCNVDFHIRSGNWLDFQTEGELLMNDEVDEILSRIEDTLNGGVGDPSVLECVEPDFRFTFHPQKDLTKDPRYTYVAPGHEIEDIKLEWSVYFWDGRLTENRLTLVLPRKDIVALRQYLISVVA
jgi:hypothetical protein